MQADARTARRTVVVAVCFDIDERQTRGPARYNISVDGNPLPLRELSQHVYEEALDLAASLKRAIDEAGPSS